jgi:hypothetical protein
MSQRAKTTRPERAPKPGTPKKGNAVTTMTEKQRAELVKKFVKGTAVEWKGSADVAKPGTKMLVEAPKLIDGVPYVRVRWANRRDVVVSPVNIVGVKVSAAELTKMREALGLRMPKSKAKEARS